MAMRILPNARVDQRGFTLAELLVAIAIVGLIMTGLLTLLMTGNETYLAGANQVETQAAVRAALERMTSDLREAGYDPQGRGACTGPGIPLGCFNAITGASATGFTIQSDWNGTGPAAPASPIEPGVVVQVSYNFGGVVTNVPRGEQITYSVTGWGALTRQESAVDAGPQTLLTGVVQASEGGALQPFFQYLDANGNVIANPTANPEGIRTIVIRLRVGVQKQTPAIWQAGAIQVTMSDRIRLRNR
jgi:prepilin-type N-terminal cleavage/methylation domain-containing protein